MVIFKMAGAKKTSAGLPDGCSNQQDLSRKVTEDYNMPSQPHFLPPQLAKHHTGLQGSQQTIHRETSLQSVSWTGMSQLSGA
jgi:hypothetical protein